VNLVSFGVLAGGLKLVFDCGVLTGGRTLVFGCGVLPGGNLTGGLPELFGAFDPIGLGATL